MYYGQNNQDKYCYENFLKDKRNGVFLDIGASDGVRFSNTYFFEKEMGYSGLCIEPRKSDFDKLRKTRSCFCENVAIDIKEQDNIPFMELKGYGSGLSGLVHRYDPRHLNRIKYEVKNPLHKGTNIIKVKTRRLETLLDEYNLHDIDLCSLDVEGAELTILKSINWMKTHIKVLIVENNYSDPEMRKYLESVGFTYVTNIKNQDEIYCA
jgi:FkbM family methyltransferase